MYLLLDVTAVIIEVTMCFIFVASFIEENRIRYHIKGILITNLLDIIFNYILLPIEVYSIFKCATFVCIMILAQFLLYRKYYDRIVVMTITYMLLLTLIDYSTVCIMTYLSGMEFSYFQEMTLFRIYGTLASKGILLASVFFIRKKLEGLKKLRRSHLFFLFILSGSILLFAFYMFQNFMLRNQILESEVTMFILLLLIELLSFFSLAAITENQEKKTSLDLLNLHNKMLQQSLEEEKNSFDLWRGRVHDYKNHIIYMQQLIAERDYERLEKFAEEETGILKSQCSYVQSGYPGIDAIINSKIVYAQSQDIHIFCNIHLPVKLSLDDGAMVVILGNLLDNAIRGVQLADEKLIEINISYMKENVYIKIVNNKQSGEINFETSSKENSQFHGIGLRSVRQQMKKLNGDFKLIQEQDKVIAIAVIFEVKQILGPIETDY